MGRTSIAGPPSSEGARQAERVVSSSATSDASMNGARDSVAMEPPCDAQERQLVASIARDYRSILEKLGENPDRQGLRRTPERAAKAMLAFTSGYSQDVRGERHA
ncbi:hypothetical protein HPB51_006690 [Rhipicephalus microplus]|uniref:GTP cyclohydrolase 1 n=1 Tax=Rhipicephalus microplus TaxID=6941 RepID=A0A9J6E7L0_RHIMP|nr:hypothetical protein HPB51_006690 [Rhipicephalus microplus]